MQLQRVTFRTYSNRFMFSCCVTPTFLVASPRLNPLDLPKTQKPVRQKKLYSSSFAIVQYCKYKSSGKYEENCFCSICTDELS